MTRNRKILIPGLALASLLAAPEDVRADPAADREAVAKLDVAYQAAVERNDADAMAQILAEDFALALGDGRSFAREDLLDWARTRKVDYERQREDPGTQVVRVWGDTAVVTARLWVKGVGPDGRPFERRLWFSDTYVRTAEGWRYVFGQASLALPAEPPARP
jgi:ketosteroid isomerase-like protein